MADFQPELDDLKERFQRLVDRFRLDKDGARPWDANVIDVEGLTASHGERVSIQFLLHVWNPTERWKCGKFDAIDAAGIWDGDKRQAFCEWFSSPFWP